MTDAIERIASKVPEVTLGFWIIKIRRRRLVKPAATPSP